MVRALAKRDKNNPDLIKNPDITFRYSLDTVVVMTALLIMGVYINGINAVKLAFSSVAVAVIYEYVLSRVRKEKNKLKDLSSVSAALAISLMLPACAPSYVAVIGTAFALVAVKLPFGSARKCPFVPAAAGFAFISVCFPKLVFTYASPGSGSLVSTSPGFVAATDFTQMLSYGKTVNVNILEVLNVLGGRNPGPMGTTCMYAMIGAGIYLLLRNHKRFIVTVFYIIGCTLMAVLFPRTSAGIYSSVLMELSAGSLVFTGLVLLPNPATIPKKTVPSMIYGFCAGVICMLLRYFGKYPESACFGVLLINALYPAASDWYEIIKAYAEKVNKSRYDKKKSGTASSLKGGAAGE